jgi:translocation and assembly module TamA
MRKPKFLRTSVFLLLLAALDAHAAKRLLEIKIDGVSKAQRLNIERFLGASSLENEGGIELSEFNAFIVRAPENVAKAMQTYGYYATQTELETTRDGNNRLVRLTIERGARTKLGKVEVVIVGPAQADASIARTVAAFPLKVGSGLDHVRYEEGKLAINNALAAHGFFDAKLETKRLIIDRANASAEIQLRWTSGKRYDFGDVTISGAQFDDAFVRGFLAIRSGAPYTDADLLETQRRLNDSEYFASVSVTQSLKSRRDGRVPIIVKLAPAPATRYSAGLSLGTDSGIGVQGSIDRRYVNDRGHKARVDALLSQRRNGLGLSYQIPREGLAFDAATLTYRDEAFKTFQAKATALTLARNDRRGLVERSYGLAFLNENFEIGATRGQAQLAYPFARLARIKRDDLLNVRRGHSAIATVRFGSGWGESAARFVAASFATKWILPAGETSRWLLRGELAAIKSNDFDNLPPSLRLFAGGDVSVRGFDFQTLSPSDSSNEPIGGSSLLVLSGEYERSINERFGIAAFLDAGNAFRDRFGSLSVGGGVGLRVASPVGPVRLDLAHPIVGEGGFQIHLVIGPDL